MIHIYPTFNKLIYIFMAIILQIENKFVGCDKIIKNTF